MICLVKLVIVVKLQSCGELLMTDYTEIGIKLYVRALQERRIVDWMAIRDAIYRKLMGWVK